jgi:DNA replication protein DnaC
VSSNKTFSASAEIFGDPVAVAAMVDRLVHHAEVIVLKGDDYRLRAAGVGAYGVEGALNSSNFDGRKLLHVQPALKVAAAYERRSVGVASRWPFESWGRFLPEHTTAVALLDRLLHRAVTIVTSGDSYRMKEARTRAGGPSTKA